MTEHDLDLLCEDWAHWCRTRKYFAPPVPANILAKMQPRSSAAREPDGPMSADIAYFNMALQRIAEDCPESAACFSLFYYYRAKNIKALAADLGISRKTFYNRMHAFARLALKWAPAVKRVHLEHSKIEEMIAD